MYKKTLAQKVELGTSASSHSHRGAHPSAIKKRAIYIYHLLLAMGISRGGKHWSFQHYHQDDAISACSLIVTTR